MNQSEYFLIGTYLALFLGPVLALIFWKRFLKLDNHILIACGLAMSMVYLSLKFGLSLSGVLADATVIFTTYILLAVGALKLTNKKNVVAKVVGVAVSVLICLVAFISIPAFLGVVFAVADFEMEYQTMDREGYGCRVSSYGNATTSTGGYNASIFKVLGPFEKEIDFESVESTRQPDITPETVCRVALSELKS